MTIGYRPELPRPIPNRILRLPVDRGYPVPWFVTWIHAGEAVARGAGEPDFRVITIEALGEAVMQKRCWVCGDRLGKYLSFVIGPMCAVNRNTAEPPCHRECAEWSARACPFLTRPRMKRNEKAVTDELGIEDMENPAGIMLRRNPGVALVWTTTSYRIYRDPQGGVLFRIGTPYDVGWFCEGRPATREEVQLSIDTGLPALEALCHDEQERAQLAAQVKHAEHLLPA